MSELWTELTILVSMYQEDELKILVPNINGTDKENYDLDDASPRTCDIREALLAGEEITFDSVELIFNMSIPTTSNDSNTVSLELDIDIPRSYPSIECFTFFIRCNDIRLDVNAVREAAMKYVDEQFANEALIATFVQFLKDDCPNYISANVPYNRETPIMPKQRRRDNFVSRHWFYSHHIYSTTKRRNLQSLAAELNLSGFTLPGKPGVICIEGDKSQCDLYGEQIKRWSWQKLVTKHVESSPRHLEADFLKFDEFQELHLSTNKRTHQDLGELRQFLVDKQLGYAFDILFGFGAKSKG